MICIEHEGIRLEFDKIGGNAKITDLHTGAVFVQNSSDAEITDVFASGGEVCVKVCQNGIHAVCVYDVVKDETGIYVRLRLNSADEFDGTLNYPPAFKVKRGDREYHACSEGLAFNVEDDIPLPNPRPLYAGTYSSMAFWGLSSENTWILAAVITNSDAMLSTEKNDEGLYSTSVMWEPEMGRWGYERELRFYIGVGNPINGITATYRRVAEQKGLVRTLKERAGQIESIDRMVGSANVWLWNNDAMDKMYSRDAVYKKPTEEQFGLRCEIARDMKESGMTDVLWSIFDENIDRKTVDYIKSLGFLTTYYDVYTDVIPASCADKIPETRIKRCEHRMDYWPEGIIREKDGSLCPAWELMGKDGKMYPQNRMCDKVIVECAEKYIKPHGVDNGIEGVFIDVSLCGTYECYSDEHPQSRREAMENKNKLFELTKSMGMFCGSENGHEDAVRNYEYNEGMMSIAWYRARNSGRRMTDIYSLDEAEESITRYMLNPRYRVPLWEMVYHDCQSSYWYWGDSTNSVPELMKIRDLFDLLYGLPPIYSIKAEYWNKMKQDIIESYKRTVPSARALRYSRMVSFDYLSEDMSVQRTLFDNGREIAVNFGDREFVYKNNVIKPHDSIILEI